MTRRALNPITDSCFRDFAADGPGPYHGEPVYYITSLCTRFKITREREGVYIARNRTEFLGGMKTYRSIESMNRDLVTR